MRQSWDDYFLDIADRVATRSKDVDTKVGAVVVKDNRILSTGYNGAPRNFPDDEVPMETDPNLPLKERKHSYMCHAEVNALLNYNGPNRDFDGATIYTTITPCHDCAKLIIQSGITKVVSRNKYHREEIFDMSCYLLQKCGVELEVKNN